jgi:hypothetical protein
MTLDSPNDPGQHQTERAPVEASAQPTIEGTVHSRIQP